MTSLRPFAVVLVMLGLSAAAQADDVLPRAQPTARYEPMAARSPFLVPSAVSVAMPTPVAAGPQWWDGMSFTSLMELGGTYFATVVDRSNNKRYVLRSGALDPESGLLLADVQWNQRVDQSTVTVRRGEQIAPALHFDATAVPANVPPPAPSYMPMRSPGEEDRQKAAMASNLPSISATTRRGTVFTGPGAGPGQAPVVKKE